MSDLFAASGLDKSGPRPLADRLRPTTLAEVAGQEHLTGPDGAPIPITAGEADLIEVFLRHPGQTLSRERLQVLTGGDGAAAGGRGIDLRILRLRQKIEADPRAPALICTLRGEGYVYRPDRS